MKTKIMSLAAAALAVAATGNAQTVIDLTGSTAGRSAVMRAVTNILTSDTFAFMQNSNNNANFVGADKQIVKGKLGTNDVIVRASWSGSAAGVRDVAQNNSSVWFPVDSINTVALNNTGINLANNTVNTVQSVAEIAFSDVFQSSTIYTSPSLTDNYAGIIPFKFYASADAPASVANMTELQAQQLWGTGYIPLAMFSGLAADQGTYAYATGRDPESGTRITAMAEVGYGVFNAVQQYRPTVVSGSVTAVELWPAGVYAEGNGGYSSGSSVKTAIGANAFSNGFGLISYLGSSDWNPTGNKELSYNGNFYTAANVKEGKYTFWGYLHQMGQPGVVGAAAPTSVTKTFYNSLLTSVQSDTTWLVKTTDMQVSRTSDGGLVTPLY